MPQSSSVRCVRTDCATRKRVPPTRQAGAPWPTSASFHRYGGVRGERDGVEFAKRRRRDVGCIAEEEGQRNRCRPAAALRADGGCGRSRGTRLRVTRRRRCPCIAFSLLLDLASQAPSANITYLSSEALNVLHEYACGARPASGCPSPVAQRTHRGACGTSSRKPMHIPG